MSKDVPLCGIRVHCNPHIPENKVLILGGGPPLMRDAWLWDLLTGEVHGPKPFNAAAVEDVFMCEYDEARLRRMILEEK